jgi:tetratricopeptide (TPR) repeat protein
VLSKADRRDQAEPILREAMKVFEQAACDFPADLFLRQEQAFSRRSLADLLNGLGRVDEAEREHRVAIAQYAALKAVAPQNSFYFREEAFSTWILGTMLEGADRLDAAAAEYGKAIALYEKASVEFPNQAVFTQDMVPLRLRLAELLRRREGPAEAKAM